MSRQQTIDRLRTMAAEGPNAQVPAVVEQAEVDPRAGTIHRRHGETADEARARASAVWDAFDEIVIRGIDPLAEAMELHMAMKLESEAALEAEDVLDEVSAERKKLREVARLIAEKQAKRKSPGADAWQSLMDARPSAQPVGRPSKVLTETFGDSK